MNVLLLATAIYVEHKSRHVFMKTEGWVGPGTRAHIFVYSI